MARSRTSIPASDLTHAVQYLWNKVQLLEIEASPKQRSEIWSIRVSGSKAERIEALNRWCEEVLTTKQWLTLKSAIRKRNQRKSNDVITITISRRAHSLLSRIAKRDNVTQSQALEKSLGKSRVRR